MHLLKSHSSTLTALLLAIGVTFFAGTGLIAEETTGQADTTVSHAADSTAIAVDSHVDTSHGADTHAEGEHHEGGHELPNIIGMIFGHKAHPEITDIQYWENVIFAFFAGLILAFIARMAYKRRNLRNPGRLQAAVEMLVEYFYDFFEAMLGKQTRRMMPLLGTLFFYILTMNLMGLVPFMKSPSVSINITASLAIIIFLYSQYIGLKELGFVGWVDHLAGSPRDITGWVLVPLMLPIHVIGEFAKPFSLAARLFGNITGEDIVIYALVGLGLTLTGSFLFVGAPLQVLFVPLGLLFSTIQALVFTILSTIYLSLMLPHGDHH